MAQITDLRYLRRDLTDEKRDRIRKFVEFLRTTGRKQGRSTLAKQTGKSIKYCCLGLACEIAMQEGLPIERKRIDFVPAIYKYGDNSSNSTAVLPTVVRDWFGFRSGDPTLLAENGEFDTASGLNDDHGYNFKRIADAFERTYLSE